MSKTMILKPKISEKSYESSLSLNRYVFEVPTNANRLTVADAVEAQYNVEVVNVNILNHKGKAKRTIRKGGRAVSGREADSKKAYVTLKEGDSIPIFDNPDDKDSKKKGSK